MTYTDYHVQTPVILRVAKKVMATVTTQFRNASSVARIVGDHLFLSSRQ